MSSIVLSTVTGPVSLVAFVELLLTRDLCDVETADVFAVQFKDGAADIVQAPATVLEGLKAWDDAEVRGDARTAVKASKLRLGSSHSNFILVSNYGVQSSSITDVEHLASDDGSMHGNRAPFIRLFQHTGIKKKET